MFRDLFMYRLYLYCRVARLWRKIAPLLKTFINLSMRTQDCSSFEPRLLWTLIYKSFGQMRSILGVRMLGQYSRVFNFKRNCQTAFQVLVPFHFPSGNVWQPLFLIKLPTFDSFCYVSPSLTFLPCVFFFFLICFLRLLFLMLALGITKCTSMVSQ